MSDTPRQPNQYPEDGSNQVAYDPASIAGHDEEQEAINRAGMEQSRKVLHPPEEADTQEQSESYAQPTLSDEIYPEPPEKRRTGLVAFGRYVKTELYDVFGEYDLSDLTEAQKRWMNADRLREILLAPSEDAKFKVGNIAINTYEYSLIARSPEHLGRAASARVLGDNSLNDERISASQRGANHAYENKLEKMQEHVKKLKDQREMIQELIKEARSPGYAHKSPERMQQLLSAAWNEFTTMLDVVHVQRGWDDEKRQSAETSLINYLTTGKQNERVGNWQKMLKLSDMYLAARTTLFSGRISAVNRRLIQNESPAQETTEEPN